ncbi:angiogenin-like [Mauremys mutica]|uniref:Ribonuclease A-domain domain-containing protein n=1 Tax=Mauremys mutica TaxID=74926 RepID=A0A9D4B6X8_9SAUR|nr:angiogenin-like [Mauremys mutica]XP_044841583.1 angiogenin-like [Mauremys mutica]KAH1182474.1 hypothetical protein KIL84_010228 [Mauremys mutica]
MALKMTPVLLLLLASALVLLGASANQDQYERFLLQHFDANPKGRNDHYCDSRMRYMMGKDKKRDRNREQKVCKDPNTFIHENSNDIKAICTSHGGRNYVTKTGQAMRQSLRPFQITTCTWHGGKPLDKCEYRATRDSRMIVIACDEHEHPVHFDESQI